MFWALKRTISFEYPQHKFRLRDNKILYLITHFYLEASALLRVQKEGQKGVYSLLGQFDLTKLLGSISVIQ